jgi:hypothetical protein
VIAWQTLWFERPLKNNSWVIKQEIRQKRRPSLSLSLSLSSFRPSRDHLARALRSRCLLIHSPLRVKRIARKLLKEKICEGVKLMNDGLYSFPFACSVLPCQLIMAISANYFRTSSILIYYVRLFLQCF